MSPEGKVKVVVRSRRVPIRTADFSQPMFSPSGVFMGTRNNRLVVYGTSLDPDQKRAIQEGRGLSCRLDLDLEVVDRGKSGIFGRILSLGRPAPTRPTIVVSPSTVS
jgi:hypothetical protein